MRGRPGRQPAWERRNALGVATGQRGRCAWGSSWVSPQPHAGQVCARSLWEGPGCSVWKLLLLGVAQAEPQAPLRPETREVPWTWARCPAVLPICCPLPSWHSMSAAEMNSSGSCLSSQRKGECWQVGLSGHLSSQSSRLGAESLAPLSGPGLQADPNPWSSPQALPVS